MDMEEDSDKEKCVPHCQCFRCGFISKSSKVSKMSQTAAEEGTQFPIPSIVPAIIQVDEPGMSIGNNVPSINLMEPEANFIAPATKSLLGADLLVKPGSLAMPPPTTTSVKKTKKLVQPGMSMVKWMKLQEGKQRPPTRRKISLSEIRKHNTESDCWMVIRNCVYDVTEYIPYHPGGAPELMKGAGIDATALFNEIHRWVNFESILKSCLLGYLLIEPGESFDESEEGEVGNVLEKSLVVSKRPLPQTSFTQNDTLLCFQVDTFVEDEMSEDNWCVALLNRERFLLKVILKPPDLWMAHVKLLQSIKDDSLTINFQNSFRRAVITLRKPSLEKWKSLGTPLDGNNQLMDSRSILIDDFCTCTIVEKESVTHDVLLIGVRPVSSSFLHVPVGFHLKIRLPGNPDLSRKYTPVNRSMIDKNSDDKNVVYFIIKIYPDGKLTKSLGLLQIDSNLEMGAVAGRYDHSFLGNCDTLALFAGGTGVTPFVKILKFLRNRPLSYPVKRILFLLFNHTEEDIIWREQWESLEKTWSIFHFHPVISTKSKDWSGFTGRVSDAKLFENVLEKTLDLGKQVQSARQQIGRFKAMTCGSAGFNDACITMLKNHSLVDVVGTEEDIFVF